MLVLMISGLVLTPVLTGYFGKEGYGVWILVGQVIAYLGVLDLGVSSSVGRFVAKYDARKDEEGLLRILNTSLFLNFLSMVIVVLVTLLIWPKFSVFFNLSEEYYKTGSRLILLTGCGIAVSLPLRIGQGIFRGTHRFDLTYLFNSLSVILKILLVVTFFYFWEKGSFILLAGINIGTALLPGVLMCLLAQRQIPKLVIKREYLSKCTLKEIWSLSFSALIISASTLIFKKAQILAVGKIASVEAVTVYAIPTMLMVYGSKLVAYITACFVPLASKMHTLGDEKQLQSLNIQGAKISFAIFLGLLVITGYFAEPFLSFWLGSKSFQGPDFATMSKLLLIMAAGFCLFGPQIVTSKMFLGSGKQWFVTTVSIARNLTGLIVGCVLLAYTRLGLYGMAIGWLLGQFTSGVIIYPQAACRHFGINMWVYLKKVYFPPIVAACVLTAAAWVVREVFGTSGFVPLAFSIALCLAVYAVAVCFICFNRGQRKEVWSIITGFKESAFEKLGYERL